MKSVKPVTIIAGIAILWIAAWALFEIFPSKSPEPQPVAPASAPATAPVEAALKMEDIKVGTGAEAVEGKRVDVHYTGTLTNGAKFDSSRDRNRPFSFTIGAGEVIKGWDQGVKGMREGGRRKLTVPPSLGYGDQAMGSDIPPNSTLLFDIELLKVK